MFGYSQAQICWQSFGLFLRARASDRGLTSQQIAVTAAVTPGVVERAFTNQSVKEPNYQALCAWMGEPVETFLYVLIDGHQSWVKP